MTSYDPHWVRALTSLGDTHRILAHQDIRAASGSRLIARGSHIDSRAFETLSAQKLAQPLESCLRVEGAVTASEFRRVAAELQEQSEPLRDVLAEVARELAPLEALAQVTLTPAMALKVTVAREWREELYLHSVVAAIIALFLAVRSRCTRPELGRAVTAALFHDLGELHLNPAMLETWHRLSDIERRGLHAHPMLIYRLLQPMHEYHPEIARAILEHHERLDGSGYPSGLSVERLSRLGRLLAVTEVIASRFDDQGQVRNCSEIKTILKLNTHKLDPQFVGHAIGIYRCRRPTDTEETAVGALREKVHSVAKLLTDWEAATAAQAGRDDHATLAAPYDFITEQVWALRAQLFDAGFNPRDTAAVLDGAEADREFLDELDFLLGETRWQLEAIAREVARRWPRLLTEADGSRTEGPLVDWLRRAREVRGASGAD